MKRYKLIKDLPTFKKGDTFHINANGDLVLDNSWVVAYAGSILDKFPNILEEWFEEISTGFYLADSGEIIKYGNEEDPYYLNYRKSIGNDFTTEEEAEKYKNYLIALQTIKDDAKGFVPDWKDGNQLKYCGCYGYIHNYLDWANAGYIQNQGIIYFKSKQDIQDSLKKHRKEWLTVLGVEK